MTIDGVDIAQYNAIQWNVTPGFSELENKSEWVSGAASPIMLKTKIGFKTLKVSVTIRGSTRQEIWKNAGNMVASLLEPREIKLEGFDHKFFMYLKNASQAEKSLNRWHKATLELVGYEYGDEVSTTTAARELVITNEGSLITPAIIEITPIIGLVSVTITGIVRDTLTGEDKPITISRLTNGATVIIDGETGLITENGVNKFHDTEIWEMPSLLPGTNYITVNQDVNLTIKYKPRFL